MISLAWAVLGCGIWLGKNYETSLKVPCRWSMTSFPPLCPVGTHSSDTVTTNIFGSIVECASDYEMPFTSSLLNANLDLLIFLGPIPP